MNIYDISLKAGVSTATVSRVLNNSPHVREDTRRRVMEVIEKSGYVPNAFARGLGLKSMKTIGLICPNASDPFLARALALMEQGFRQRGYDCLLCCTGTQLEDRQEGVEKLTRRHVDGLVLMGSGFIEPDEAQNEYIREAAQNVPVVLLNGELKGDHIYSIRCDDRTISCEAVQYLLDSGCRRILYLYHSLNFAGRRKLEGYRAGYASRNLPVDEQLMIHVPQEEGDVRQVREMLLALETDGMSFDAVYTSEDSLAVGAAKYAAAAGRKVPDALSIMGYNNSDICLACEPELSSVDNRLEDICVQVVGTMMDVLDGKDACKSIIFPGALVKRSSTRT